MRLQAIALDPAIEREIAEALTQTQTARRRVPGHGARAGTGSMAVRARALVEALKAQAEHAVTASGRPVLICSARVRRHLRRLVEQSVPKLAVCSYNEIMPGVQVETVGMVHA